MFIQKNVAFGVLPTTGLVCLLCHQPREKIINFDVPNLGWYSKNNLTVKTFKPIKTKILIT